MKENFTVFISETIHVSLANDILDITIHFYIDFDISEIPVALLMRPYPLIFLLPYGAQN